MCTQGLLQGTDGRVEYRHATGETAIARIEPAGMCLHSIRRANVPPEGPEGTLRVTLATSCLSMKKHGLRQPLHGRKRDRGGYKRWK